MARAGGGDALSESEIDTLARDPIGSSPFRAAAGFLCRIVIEIFDAFYWPIYTISTSQYLLRLPHSLL